MEGCTAAAGDRDRARREGTREKKRAQAEKMARVKKKFCDESENGVDFSTTSATFGTLAAGSSEPKGPEGPEGNSRAACNLMQASQKGEEEN